MSVNQTQIRESSSSTANNFPNDRAIPKNVPGSKNGIFGSAFSKYSTQNYQSEKSAPEVYLIHILRMFMCASQGY